MYVLGLFWVFSKLFFYKQKLLFVMCDHRISVQFMFWHRFPWIPSTLPDLADWSVLEQFFKTYRGLRWKLKVSSGIFWAWNCLGICMAFKISPYTWLLLNVLITQRFSLQLLLQALDSLLYISTYNLMF